MGRRVIVNNPALLVLALATSLPIMRSLVITVSHTLLMSLAHPIS